MSGWVASFPAGRDRWELVSSLARERQVLPHILVEQLRHAGASPMRIGGVWMVKASEFASVEACLPPHPAGAVKPSPKPSAPAALPEAIADAMQRQASALEVLRREIETMSRQLAEERSE